MLYYVAVNQWILGFLIFTFTVLFKGWGAFHCDWIAWFTWLWTCLTWHSQHSFSHSLCSWLNDVHQGSILGQAFCLMVDWRWAACVPMPSRKFDSSVEDSRGGKYIILPFTIPGSWGAAHLLWGLLSHALAFLDSSSYFPTMFSSSSAHRDL